MGRHEPFHGVLGRARRHERAGDKPAVVVLGAPVEKLDLPALDDLDRHALLLGLGGHGELRPVAERRHLVVAVGDGPRPVRLPGECPELPADLVGFPEEDARVELEVEADLADPGGRKGLVQVHDDPEGAPVGLHLDDVAELKVGIADRIEALPVDALVGVGHVDADLPGVPVDDARRRRPASAAIGRASARGAGRRSWRRAGRSG